MGEPLPAVMAPDQEAVVGLLQHAIDAVPVRVPVGRMGHQHTLPRRGSSGQDEGHPPRSLLDPTAPGLWTVYPQ